jgi:hypothetical protein
MHFYICNMKIAYNPKSSYFYVRLWPCIHLPNLMVESVARLPHFAQAADIHF